MVKTISLTQGKVALVDNECFTELSHVKWCAILMQGGYWYATRSVGGHVVYMHRVILNAPKGACVDHVNGDGLDNQLSNLRLAKPMENSRNSRPHRDRDRASPYKGVTRRKDDEWDARIFIMGHDCYLGSFNSAEEAAKVYDKAARFVYGEFARTNFPVKP